MMIFWQVKLCSKFVTRQESCIIRGIQSIKGKGQIICYVYSQFVAHFAN
jgi:hypothetical protein